MSSNFILNEDFKRPNDAKHAVQNVKKIVEVPVDWVAPVEGTADDSDSTKKRGILRSRLTTV
jgi:hypothetical protein